MFVLAMVFNLILAIVSITLAGEATVAHDQRPPKVDISAEFQCLWWNAQQIDGIDPTNPPLKQTRVTIKRWEYSDPIGVPHPDSVDLTVEIRSKSAERPEKVTAEITVQWLEGLQTRKASAVWTRPIPVRSPVVLQLLPSGRVKFTVPINILHELNVMEHSRKWPWALRAIVSIRSAGNVVGSSHFDLPIIPGD
jgi:hypothetical protein